jgi:uncharacterized membrane protein
MKIFNKDITLKQAMPWILVICGAIGLACALIIMYDKVELMQNPHFQPNCDLNPVVSCGSVMQSDQAAAFGFPNPFIGIAGFSIVLTMGMAMLAGAKFKRWLWLGLEAGIIAGLVFAFWLLFESVYRINALCPYCLAVDVVVITLIWYTTLFLVEKKFIPLKGKLLAAAGFARRHHLDILVGIFVVLIAVILKHFWYYYGQHL